MPSPQEIILNEATQCLTFGGSIELKKVLHSTLEKG